MKAKISLILILIFGFAGGLFSQDVIVKLNGDEIEAKVIEITQDNIRYKRFSNLSGPDYVVETAGVFMIKYENGGKDVVEKNAQTGAISVRFVEGVKLDEETVQPTTKETAQPATPVQTQVEAKAEVSAKPAQASPPKSQNPTDAKEQYELALAYEEGTGVNKDTQKAADWYQKSAEKGYADAQYRFGLLCMNARNLTITLKEDFTMRNGTFVNSDGLPIDKATARYWWRKAAAQGHVEAKAKLKELEDSLK